MTQTGRIQASDGKYLPIVSAYARTVGLVEEVDRLCGAKEGVGYGTVVLPLVWDTLSGRSPLFRLPQAFAKLDTDSLLGERLTPDKLNDDVTGRFRSLRSVTTATGRTRSSIGI